MAINMAALEKAAEGDPNARVEVNKRWLGEVRRLLVAGEWAERELARVGRSHDIFEAIFPPPRRSHGGGG